MSTSSKIVVRIPPSPTGFFHVGRARTALFNYLFAKKNNGKIIFRIEDTDKERSKKEYEEDIIESLKWLGISYDEGPFRQSERNEVYSKFIGKMLKDGTAYLSTESEGENKEVIRFKNPNKIVTFTDLIRGEISTDTTDLKDFVIAKSIDEPLYHLTVVVDDFEMGVTHIIRGDDGIANTPRQILIQEAIGAERPIYAHVPLILAPDKSKMSARHGAVSLKDFREAGYLPETMVNFLALLGFNPGGEKEIYSAKELISVFDISRVQKGGAIFNLEKLDWMNKEHMKLLPEDERNEKILEYLKNNKAFSQNEKINDNKFLSKIFPIIFDHISKWGDINTMIGAGELDYFFDPPKYDSSLLYWKGKIEKEEVKTHLLAVNKIISEMDESDLESPENIKSAIFPYAEKVGRGNVLWPLRVALSGKEKSPDPFTLLYVFGKSESISRIDNAIKIS
jgi:glutamyl-tRNA synthetase